MVLPYHEAPSPDAGETGTTSTFSTGVCVTHNAVRQWEKRQHCQRLGDACEEFATGKLHQILQFLRGGTRGGAGLRPGRKIRSLEWRWKDRWERFEPAAHAGTKDSSDAAQQFPTSAAAPQGW